MRQTQIPHQLHNLLLRVRIHPYQTKSSFVVTSSTIGTFLSLKSGDFSKVHTLDLPNLDGIEALLNLEQ